MIRLSKSQVLLIYDWLIAETGGSSGLRDEEMLDSALIFSIHKRNFLM